MKGGGLGVLDGRCYLATEPCLLSASAVVQEIGPGSQSRTEGTDQTRSVKTQPTL